MYWCVHGFDNCNYDYSSDINTSVYTTCAFFFIIWYVGEHCTRLSRVWRDRCMDNVKAILLYHYIIIISSKWEWTFHDWFRQKCMRRDSQHNNYSNTCSRNNVLLWRRWFYTYKWRPDCVLKTFIALKY